MKCTLMGVQEIKFTDEKTGEVIEGRKLHVVAELKEAGGEMTGQRVDAVFTRLNVDALKIGSEVDLVYTQPLGSKRVRLVAVVPFESAIPQTQSEQPSKTKAG